MRTNIEIDDAKMAEALATGSSTKRAAVDEALALLLQRRRQASAIEQLWGSDPDWQGDLDAWRRDA